MYAFEGEKGDERMQKVLVIGIGGFIGSNLRYWISYLVNSNFKSHNFWGTLTVNMIGCLIIGALMSYHLNMAEIESNMKILVVTGLLGALTTFSTFSFETVEMIQDARIHLAVANVLMNVFFGLGAVFIGFEAVKRLA